MSSEQKYGGYDLRIKHFQKRNKGRQQSIYGLRYWADRGRRAQSSQQETQRGRVQDWTTWNSEEN